MTRRKINHALHVKSRTQGFSNELSVSVLDAAREKQDARERAPRTSPLAGKVSLFTLGKGKKVRSTPEKDQGIVLSEGMPQARSHSRARGLAPTDGSARPASVLDAAPVRFVPLIVIACALLALVLTAGQTMFQVRDYRQNLTSTLAGYIETINQADDVVIPFDELVMRQYDENHFADMSASDVPPLDELSEDYSALVDDVAPARTSLEETAAAIEGLQPSLSDNADAEAARQALVAAQSRLAMFDTGASIVDESLIATEAYTAAEAGWEDILDADAAAREATDLLRDMNMENVQASMEKSNDALALLNSAADHIVAAQNAYPNLDLGSYLAYVNKRIESQQAALSSDQAYLDRDKKLLEQENERYNALESEAADLAKELDGDPAATVEALYRDALAEPVERYEDARLKAANADAFLRDYLGSSEQ